MFGGDDQFQDFEWQEDELFGEDIIPCTMNTLDEFISSSNCFPVDCNVSVLCVNIRSMRKNFKLLELFLDSVKIRFGLIIITETWLTSSIDFSFCLPGYKCLSIYPNSNGGGIKVYHRDHYTVKLCEELTCVDELLELLSFSVVSTSQNVLFCCVYRPPSGDISTFNDIFFDKLFNVRVPSEKIFLCGDFNINLFNPFNKQDIRNFIYNCSSLGLYPIIRKPTRFSNQDICVDGSFSLIDHMWCNFPLNSNSVSGVIDADIADHLLTYVISPVSCDTERNIISYRVYSDENREKFTRYVNSRIYDHLFQLNNPNVCLNLLLDTLYEDYDKAHPLRTKSLRVNTKSAPWFTSNLKFLTKKSIDC